MQIDFHIVMCVVRNETSFPRKNIRKVDLHLSPLRAPFSIHARPPFPHARPLFHPQGANGGITAIAKIARKSTGVGQLHSTSCEKQQRVPTKGLYHAGTYYGARLRRIPGRIALVAREDTPALEAAGQNALAFFH